VHFIKELVSNIFSNTRNEEAVNRRLHIGGVEQKDGWEILNTIKGEFVDHVRQADDLTVFEENSFIEIYASHVLEHMDFTGEIQNALKEWFRVLTPGGKIYISIPDLDVLARLFLNKDLSLDDRFYVVKMIFGGHIDQHDYHKVGLDEELLTNFVSNAGFTNITRVDEFGLFNDTSNFKYAGTPISINIIAIKPSR